MLHVGRILQKREWHIFLVDLARVLRIWVICALFGELIPETRRGSLGNSMVKRGAELLYFDLFNTIRSFSCPELSTNGPTGMEIILEVCSELIYDFHRKF